MAKLITSLVSDVDEFAAMRREWRCLLEQCEPNHVFMTWEWLFTWWTHFGRGKQLFILVVRNGGDLIGLLPLMLATYPLGYGDGRSRGRYLHFIGFRPEQRWNDWMDIPAIRKSEVIESGFDYLRAHQYLWDFLDLWDVPEDSETVPAMLSAAHRVTFPVVSRESTGSRPYLPTTSDWQTYYRSNVSNRQEKERRVRRLQDKGAAFVKAEPATLMSHVTSLFELYQKGEAEGRKLVKFSRPVYQDFYRSLTRVCPFDWLYCPVLELDAKPIAACFGFRYNSKYLYLTPVFDPEYARLSPGTVLLRFVIEDCFADGEISEFDFGRGTEAYKYEWTATERQGLRIQLGNNYYARWIGKALRRMPIAGRRLLMSFKGATSARPQA